LIESLCAGVLGRHFTHKSRGDPKNTASSTVDA
jgi:hypothetical protein